jgi:hypothetical protein
VNFDGVDIVVVLDEYVVDVDVDADLLDNDAGNGVIDAGGLP